MVKRLLVLLLVFAPLVITCCTPDNTDLQWQREEDYRWAAVEPGYFDDGGLQEMDSSVTNIHFSTHVTQKEVNENQIVLNGTGVATADVDGDGWTDIYFTQLNGPNKLYKNVAGFQFRDITEQAGVAHEGNYSTGTLFADVDGDYDHDLLVSTIDGHNAVYINDGQGRFELKEDSGLQNGNGSTTMTMADIDNDGDLDLFVANNKKRPIYDIFSEEELEPENLVKRPEGRQIPGKTRYEFKEPFGQFYRFIYRKNQRAMMEEVGEYNRLYLNDGTGQFTNVTKQEGRFLNHQGKPATLKREWSLTARFQDINGDQHPDLYVCNDYFNPDRVWLNQGDGSFREIDKFAIRSFSYSSMGVDISDINRDGHYDFFVTEMLSSAYHLQASQFTSIDMRPGMIIEPHYQPQYMHNSMYLNRGDNTFQEIAYYSGLEASEWSWATRFLDLDLDGYEDLIINTGYAYDAIDMDYSYNSSRYKGAVDLTEAPELNLQNKIFRNNGDLTFSEVSEDWGFTKTDVSYGLATADFDNDGDLDIVTSRLGSKAALFKNMASNPRIAVRLKGKGLNTNAIGAEVELENGPVRQLKQVVAGGDYLSGSTTQLMFAARSGEEHRLIITWPSGKTSMIDSVRANRIYEISEPVASDVPRPTKSPEIDRRPIFEDASALIDHHHQAIHYDDFERQPLMPYKISSEGPAVAWVDFDLDNDDDLLIGNGQRGSISVYENQGAKGFIKNNRVDMSADAKGVPSAFLGWRTSGGAHIIVGNSNYERNIGDNSIPSARHLFVDASGTVTAHKLSHMNSSTGPVSAADYDMDGDVDLFVGGRVIRGKYPRDASSILYLNNDGKFTQDKSNTGTLTDVGLVTGAVFSDYDGDGDPDLILSCEWGFIRVFQNQGGAFLEQTDQLGLGRYKGQWKSVSTGDFNNDGQVDIVATNVGRNSPYQPAPEHPIKMYYSDLNMDNRVEIIEAHYDHQMDAYVPMQKLYDFSIFSTFLASRINSFDQYASQSLKQLLGRSLNQIPSKEINTVEHTLFINTGNAFEAKPLPAEAQFTTAMGATVSDYNNDGNEDLFISQNFFEFYETFPRQDAGRGLWLRGDGNGGFEPVSASESGVKIYGEQRGAALSDFNSDGRVDIVVTQRDSTTKLYRNTIDKRGIRVRLEGPASNNQGIGSSLRLVYSDGSEGPVREVQAGSGHWSMNSTTAVLGTVEGVEPEKLEVHWFDGTQTSVEIEPGKWNYNVIHFSRKTAQIKENFSDK